MSEICPFCKRDPFHYVHNGIGMEPVAIDCCNLGVALWGGNRQVAKIAELKRSGSPRKQARAKRMMDKLDDN